MTIILGFGSTEKSFEQNELNFVKEFLVEKSKVKIDLWFNDELIEELRSELKSRADEYRRLDSIYKTAPNFPERYSYYNFNILHDLGDLCVIFEFWHTSRRHALSPDGWALLRETEVLHANVWSYKK